MLISTTLKNSLSVSNQSATEIPADPKVGGDGVAAECAFSLGNAAEVRVPGRTAAGNCPQRRILKEPNQINNGSPGRVAYVQKHTFRLKY